jgi:hypothetical protein
MTVIYRTSDSGKWGSGKGSALTAAEVDGNFWDHEGRIGYIEDHPPNAISVAYFEVTGGQFYVHLTDASRVGPYSLPVMAWNFRGAWAPDTVYVGDDIVTVNGGTYRINWNHTSADEFDAGANDGSGHDYYSLLLLNPDNSLPSGGTTGQVLAKLTDLNYQTVWISLSLDGLPDVSIDTGVANGDVLTYHAASGSWINQELPASAAVSVEDLTDVSVPTAGPSAGDVLLYDGAAWSATTLDAGVVPFTPTGNISAIDTQAAIAELDSEKAGLGLEGQVLTGGASVTSKSLGTLSSGTLTPDPGARAMQHYTNNGAHTLAPGTTTGSYLIDITNGASAGAITTSGWTKVAGDAFDTTNGHKFRCHASIGNAGSLLSVQALQ